MARLVGCKVGSLGFFRSAQDANQLVEEDETIPSPERTVRFVQAITEGLNDFDEFARQVRA